MLCKVIDGISYEYKDDTGVNLSGLSENLEKNKTELLSCYKAIYQQYGGQIGQYISPINMVLIINVQNGIHTAVNNAKEETK